LKDQPITIPVVITNTGKTPAREVHGKFVAIMVLNGQSPDFTYSDQFVFDETEGIMFPKGPEPFEVSLMRLTPNKRGPWILTEAESADLQTGKIFLEIYGETTYQDVFNTTHWLHFCRPYSPATPPSIDNFQKMRRHLQRCR
jgi:hypothetical protein